MPRTYQYKKWICTKTIAKVMVCMLLIAGMAWAGSDDELSKPSRSSTLAPELRSKPFDANIGLEFQAAAMMMGSKAQARRTIPQPDAHPAITDNLNRHRAGMDAPDTIINAAQPMDVDDINPHRAGMDTPNEAAI